MSKATQAKPRGKKTPEKTDAPNKAAILKAAAIMEAVANEEDSERPSTGSGKAGILEAAASPEEEAPFNWAKHSRRQEVCKAGIWGALGKPFNGFEWRFLSVHHPKVNRAIAHAEAQGRRAAGLRGATATPADPNPPEVLMQINRAAVLAGTRSLRGRVSLGSGKDDLHAWSDEAPKDGSVQRLSEEDAVIWKHMLAGSYDLVMRCLGQMQNVGRASDDEILKLDADQGVFGRDLVVTDDDA